MDHAECVSSSKHILTPNSDTIFADLCAGSLPTWAWLCLAGQYTLLRRIGTRSSLTTSRFDIHSFGNFDAQEDEAGFAQSAASIDDIIATEVEAGISANRIVLGGFSQGGAMSLLTGLTKRKLAGISVLSGWLPLRHKFKEVSPFRG